MAINHYQLLGISEDADLRQIKSAYRHMAKRFHPDANKGSEAAAELFRKINEAYRILSDEQLRNLYNQQIVKTSPPVVKQPAAKKPTVPIDPQQKFNRFLNSLLDAVFVTPEASSAKKKKPPSQTVHKVRRKPDFNFYYCLAMEKSATPYCCGEDGIYRHDKRRSQKPAKRNSVGRIQGSGIVMLLLTGLRTIFTP